MVDKVLRRLNGKNQQYAPTVTSAGTADAGKIPALGPDGRLDVSLLSSLPVTKYYESAQTAWVSGGLLTFTHGLGVEPKFEVIECVVTTAQGGAVVGDKFNPTLMIVSGGYNGAQVVSKNSTTVSVRCTAAMLRVLNGTSGDQVTAANSRIILRAFV